jgi:CheY-like chemotaxis protein
MGSAADVLLIDDNVADQRLILEALKEQAWVANAVTARDTTEAMALLTGGGKTGKSTLPGVIVLDLEMRGEKKGFEFLALVKESPRLKHIPVVVLSSSESGRDVSRSYSLGADSYLVKPYDFEGFRKSAKRIGGIWEAASIAGTREASGLGAGRRGMKRDEIATYAWLSVIGTALTFAAALS